MDKRFKRIKRKFKKELNNKGANSPFIDFKYNL